MNLQVILANPRAQFKRRGSQPGMQESDFLKQITKVTELEPKANNCTRVSTKARSPYSDKINVTFDLMIQQSGSRVFLTSGVCEDESNVLAGRHYNDVERIQHFVSICVSGIFTGAIAFATMTTQCNCRASFTTIDRMSHDKAGGSV